MLLVLRLLRRELSISYDRLGYETEEEAQDESAHLTIIDSAFGFAPDPVFPELDWGEDEDTV